MAGLNSGDIVEVTMIGSLHSQVIRNVFHYQILNESTATTYIEAAQAFCNDFDAGTDSPGLAMLDCAGSSYIWEKTRVQRIYPTRDMYVEALVDLPGTREEEARSTNLSAVITKRGPFGNRHNIGSLHIAGVPESIIVAGEWPAGYKTYLDIVATRMTALYQVPLETLDARMCIYNRENPALSVRVQVAEPKETVRVMRRRTVRVGE